jgi:hypothetical protein
MTAIQWLGALLPTGLLITFGLLRGFYARRSYAGRKRPSRILTLTTPRPWKEVRESLISLSTKGIYKLEEDQPDQQLLTLSSRPTGFSWGFFFPVYGDFAEGGGTQLTIGIESKFIQAGPVVTHHHRKCLGTLKETLERQ